VTLIRPESAAAPDNVYLGQRLAAAGYSTLHATDETRFSNVRALWNAFLATFDVKPPNRGVLSSFWEKATGKVLQNFAVHQYTLRGLAFVDNDTLLTQGRGDKGHRHQRSESANRRLVSC